jgi:hypothetical protein
LLAANDVNVKTRRSVVNCMALGETGVNLWRRITEW